MNPVGLSIYYQNRSLPYPIASNCKTFLRPFGAVIMVAASNLGGQKITQVLLACLCWVHLQGLFHLTMLNLDLDKSAVLGTKDIKHRLHECQIGDTKTA